MSINTLVKGKREYELIEMINNNFDRIDRLSPQGVFSSRIRIGKQINELGGILKGYYPNSAIIGIFLQLCINYIDEVNNCTNRLIMAELTQVSGYKNWAKQYILDSIVYFQHKNAMENAFTEERIERHLTLSKDHSRKFKVVVSRDGNGSNADHYKLHGPLLPQDADDDCSIKKHFDGWEEFLTDEDGKRAEQNLRDVTVREVRLGKIVAKIEPVQEVVYKVVKK